MRAARFIMGALVMGGLVTSGCGGGSPPRVSTPSAPAAKVDDTPFTDGEYVERLWVEQGQVWALGAYGLVRWFPTERRHEVIPMPAGVEGRVTAAALVGGTWYFGLSRGLLWREPTGQWRFLGDGPLAGGVTALAPGLGGRLWVGMAQALGRFDGATLELVSRRHRIQDLSSGPGGRVWAATSGHGVLEVGEDALIEHTPAQGVCDLNVSSISAATDGTVSALCAGRGMVSALEGDQWSTWRVTGAGAPLRSWVPYGGGALLWAGDRLWTVATGPQAPSAAQISGPRLLAAKAPTMAAPPLPAVPQPNPAAPAVKRLPPEAGAGEAPEAPPPATPEPAEGAPEEAAPEADDGQGASSLGLVMWARAQVPGGDTATDAVAPTAGAPATAQAAPTLAFGDVEKAQLPIVEAPMRLRRAEALGAPADGAPRALRPHPGANGLTFSAATASPDGTLWIARPHRGLVAWRDGKASRLLTHSLHPGDDRGVLLSDGAGGVMLRQGGELLRLQGGKWRPWSPGPVGMKILTLGPDPRGGAWAVGHVPGSGELSLLKGVGDQKWTMVGRLGGELPERPVAGRLRIGPDGALYFPMFARTESGRVIGWGLARVPSDLSALERWEGDLLTAVEADAARPQLPDGWVNGVFPTKDAVWVSSNAGLVKVQGAEVKVFDENAFMDSEVIFSAVATKDAVWVASLEGLGRIVGDEWKGVTSPEGLTAEIRDLLVTPEGRVWAGGADGLWQWVEGQWRPSKRPITGVLELTADGRGGIWALTTEGVVQVNPRP